MEETGAPAGAPPEPARRHPAIARACFHLNGVFLACWAIYLAGPDALGVAGPARGGLLYGVFIGGFFALHFVLISTGIIALFVVIIEVHARRPVRGFPSVLLALALPIASFLYFVAWRYLEEVLRWLRG
jgi:hypothetical protein